MPEDYETTDTDNKLLKKARKQYLKYKDHPFEKNWRKNAMKHFKYVSGEDQGWDEKGDRATLEGEGRPAFTLNKVHPIFRLICGSMPEIETKYNPTEEGDIETADIFNSTKNHVDKINKWQFMNKDWFKYAISLNRSVIELRPNYDMDPRGEIELRLRDGFEFLFDPNSKEKDRSDMEDMFEIFLLTPDQAKRAFPDNADKIDEVKNYKGDSDESSEKTSDSGEPDEYTDSRLDYVDASTNRIKICRYWYKEYGEQTKIVDLAGGAVFTSPKKPKEIRDELEKMSSDPDRFALIPRSYKTVKFITFIYDEEMERGVTPWEREDGQPTKLSDNFPFIIFEPDRFIVGTRQELLSLIEPMMDPQKYYNKLASAVVEIIGAGTSVGVDYEENSLPNDADEKKLKKYGAKIGSAMKWAAGAITGGKFKYRTGTVNPQAELVAAKEMSGALLDISGVESLISTESLGKGASGEAIREKKTQGANVISWVYDSHRFFNHTLAEFLRDAIQVMYDYSKVIRIRGSNPRFVRINDQMFDETGAIKQVLNDVTTGNFDVDITDKPIEPSARVQRFVAFSEMVKSGVLPLPPPVLVKILTILMDDPELKQVIEEGMDEWNQMLQNQSAQGNGNPELAQAA